MLLLVLHQLDQFLLCTLSSLLSSSNGDNIVPFAIFGVGTREVDADIVFCLKTLDVRPLFADKSASFETSK
jgi:hypothetical protein